MYSVLDDEEGLIDARKDLFALLDERELDYKVQVGEKYADEAAKRGDYETAFNVYEELFLIYQKYAQSNRYTYSKRVIFDDGAIELEPFASRENFERYLTHKKQEWESKKRTK
mgnify:CR=1 FL=1